ncbi:MAG TPA: plasmid partitioning protein RepB [Gammaproteobacteria bacterium]|jgi:ParB family chromosome partitioning protein|nr:plasmid partitioning protein RepB [Gammaproteobacteria bacterium]
MARKDLLKNVMETQTEAAPKGDRANYALRGASKSMKVSIDHLAENTKLMLEGETIVEISPDLIDGSFVSDRLGRDDEAFNELKKSIADGRQDSPVLLRPHPEDSGRYMIVFGHRRVRVAAELGRAVRAVVKSMDDVAHILAQGQENTARADLSFIEKALFAKRLLDLGQPKDIIQSALTIDPTLLSRMLSVSQKIPSEVIEEIGAAKSVGRDRWEDFKKLIVISTNAKQTAKIISSNEFQHADSNARFELLHKQLSANGKSVRKLRPKKNPGTRSWSAGNGQIKGVMGKSGKAFNISLSSSDAAEFGAFLSDSLDQLYQSFKDSKQEKSK